MPLHRGGEVNMKKEEFIITGMTCSACSSTIQNGVNKLNGIKEAQVNLLANKMMVEYDEKQISSTQIIDTVCDLGYGASLKNGASTPKKENIGLKEYQQMKKRCILSFIFMLPLFYLSMGHMMNWPLPNFFLGYANTLNFAFTQLLLALIIVFINQHYYINGFKNLIKRHPNMDSLIAIGSFAALVYGIFAIYQIGMGMGSGNTELVHHYAMDLYFETSGMILTLITLGKTLETRSKKKTSDAISKLMDYAPKTAIVFKDGVEVECLIEDVHLNDICLVKPGAKIPVDGIILEGFSSIDESMISGESIPVDKTVNDQVIAATINKSGSLKIQATKIGQDTTLSKIIQLVEEASSTKAPISKLADKVSGVFVPVVITISIITAIVWLVLGATIEEALSSAIAVLVISCPCALGLATPTAIMVGTGQGASNGILIKSAEALETAHHIDTVVLDKTGTITEGKPKVTDIFEIDEKLLPLAYAMEKNSEHPLALAVVQYAQENHIEPLSITDFQAVSGKGITSSYENKKAYAGNRKFMEENGIALNELAQKEQQLSLQGKTVLYFALDHQVLGACAIADTIKPSSIQAIDQMRAMGLEVMMVTGDNQLVAKNIAKKAHIKEIRSEVLPHQKGKIIEELQKQGKKVCMIGDGINDALALTLADVGMAIGAGTDVAIESADFVLIKNDLMDVVSAIQLSKATIKNIKQNLFWALCYNSIGIPLAAGLFIPLFGWRLNPMFGALAMSFSSVSVVSNALRLRGFKPKLYPTIQSEEEAVEIQFENIKGEEKMMNKKMMINGMMCMHCKARVEKVLSEVDGVESVTVNLEEKCADLSLNKEVNNDTLKAAVENAGYEVIEVK